MADRSMSMVECSVIKNLSAFDCSLRRLWNKIEQGGAVKDRKASFAGR